MLSRMMICPMRSVCAWDGLTELDERLGALTRRQLERGETSAVQPMLSLWMDTGPATRLAVADYIGPTLSSPRNVLNTRRRETRWFDPLSRNT